MAYIGNNLQVAFQSYQVIDDISSSFNGVTTSFPLRVNGITPSPFPINPQQCLIIVGGVPQKPDLTGAEGFTFSGSNIVLSSAPSAGEKFWGVILAGADYVNVGANFPSGSALAPSITFDSDNDTGIYNSGANQLSFTTGGTERARFDSAGRFGVGTSTPVSELDVNGRIAATSGTASIPSFHCRADTNTGINLPENDRIQFIVGGSEAARIDASSRLLVGTSSAFTPPNPISVQVAGGGIGIGTYVGASSGTYTLEFLKSRSSTTGGVTSVAASDNLGQITFSGTDGTQAVQAATIRAEVDGTPGTNDMPGRLVFSTTADGASSPTERMRINNAGSVYIGATEDPSATVGGAGFSQSTNSRRILRLSTLTTSANNLVQLFNSNGQVGDITVSGTSTAYNTSSDYRLKENVVPLTGAIDRINQLQVHRFNFIADPDKTVDGFIAHEAQAVVPEAVTGEKDAVDDEGNPVYQGIDQSKLVPLLTAALQEAIAKIETLEAKVAALEAA